MFSCKLLFRTAASEDLPPKINSTNIYKKSLYWKQKQSFNRGKEVCKIVLKIAVEKKFPIFSWEHLWRSFWPLTLPLKKDFTAYLLNLLFVIVENLHKTVLSSLANTSLSIKQIDFFKTSLKNSIHFHQTVKQKWAKKINLISKTNIFQRKFKKVFSP